MSASTDPITPARFSAALESLSLESLYAKTHEINNSIYHLQNSNKTLQEYSDSIKDDASIDPGVRRDGDQDCLDAIRENEVVIERMRGRVRLIKEEVERRGQIWHEKNPEGEEGNGEDVEMNGSGNADATVNGSGSGDGMGSGQHSIGTSASNGSQSTVAAQSVPQASGRLTDEQLRRQLENLLPEDSADDEGGMHL